MKNIESLLQEYGEFHHASVTCGGDFGTADQSGAAYEAVMEAIDNHHSGLQDELNAANTRIAKLESLVAERDAMLGKRPCQNSRCNDLNAARALLREILDLGEVHYEAADKVRAYFDACDTLEGK